MLPNLQPHIFYATFNSRADAMLAMWKARTSGIDHRHYTVNVHRDSVDQKDLSVAESDFSGSTILRGGLLGGLCGILIGLTALAVTTSTSVTAPLIAALTVAGAGFGAFGASLYALVLPERHLARLGDALERGRFLLTVEAADAAERASLERIFMKYGDIKYPDEAMVRT